MKYMDPLAKPFSLKGTNDKVILLIHGLTGSPGKLRLLAEHLNQKGGYSVEAILLNGHGTTMEDLSVAKYTDWINDVEKAYFDLKEKYDKVFLGGFSMGGLLALYLASKYDMAEKIFTIAAAIQYNDPKVLLAPIIKHFMKYNEWEDISNDPEISENYLLKYNVGYKGIPISSIAEMLKLRKIVRKNIKKVTITILISQSKADETVSPKAVDYIYNNVSSKQKDILWVENSKHIAIMGPERDIIFEGILDFLNA